MADSIADLISRFARLGKLQWIGVRPERRADMRTLESVVISRTGLAGDRRNTPGKRAVTLIQAEHLPVIASLAGRECVAPELLRRNLVVSGINLLALRNSRFRVGQVLLQGTGLCAPCSRMEEALGPGGYTAMRGHGGITASVLESGTVQLADPVMLEAGENPGLRSPS